MLGHTEGVQSTLCAFCFSEVLLASWRGLGGGREQVVGLRNSWSQIRVMFRGYQERTPFQFASKTSRFFDALVKRESNEE